LVHVEIERTQFIVIATNCLEWIHDTDHMFGMYYLYR